LPPRNSKQQPTRQDATLKLSSRARWSLADQVLVSGANFLIGVLLIRSLGLEMYGVYSLVLIAIQFLAGIQVAAILSPMMSLFDQRGATSIETYLSAVLIHQVVLAIAVITCCLILALLPHGIVPSLPIDLAVAAALVITTQFQDLTRRFFYVTDRPVLAILSDLTAHGGRLAIIAWLAYSGTLSMPLVWMVIIGCSALSLAFVAPDLTRARFIRQDIAVITNKHKAMAGWMIGNTVVAWFSESGFVLLIVGAVLGPVEVGAARAIQNLILVVNLMIQSLENFVPSAAAKHLVNGGPAALRNYVGQISALGAGGIFIVTIIVMALNDQITQLVYNQSFPHQFLMLAIFGVFYAMGHVLAVVFAGLRALQFLQSAFWTQLFIGVGSLIATWFVASEWGVIGALFALLAARTLMTGQLSYLFWSKTSLATPKS
jgi:O-antigen/teichoic acid export membrane protein